jgi:hypothetical protein
VFDPPSAHSFGVLHFSVPADLVDVLHVAVRF